MGSKVVVTYKRKRLFSRSDHSLVNLHSDTSRDCANSKITNNFPKQEVPIVERTLQNNDTGVGRHAYSKNNVGEDVLQCENCKSHCCSQCSEDARKPKMACTEHKDSSVSQPPDACSGAEPDPVCLRTSAGINGSCQTKGLCTSEASNSEAKDTLNTDKYTSLCSGIKRKLTSALITFCRRSKRKREDIAANSTTLSAANCQTPLLELPEDNYNSCSFSAPVPATSMVGLADTHQHFPPGEAAESPNAAAHHCEDSLEQIPQQRVNMDALGNCHINMTTHKLKEDAKSRIIHSDVSRSGDPVWSMDLSVPPRASINIDCNQPLDCGSDENEPVKMSEVIRNSLGSTSNIKEDMPSLPVQHIGNGCYGSDKGKSILDSPTMLTCNSSKNNYIQFLPESPTDSTVQLTNNSENVSWLDPSNLIDLSLQPEQMVDSRACFPPLYEFPNIQVQPRESFHNHHPSTSDRTQSFARDKMMLEYILTRARAMRGSRSTFLEKLEYPNTWLDEELDSLWIGVRRHGRGNWDAILGDRRLHFLPWKSPWDLAERWQVEQSRLLCSMPISQPKYASPPDFSSEQLDEVGLSLGCRLTVQKGLAPLHYMNKTTKRDLPDGSGFPRNHQSSSTAGLIKGSLPFGWLNQPSQQQQPSFSNRQIYVQSDEHVVSKHEDLIMIPSDASSEETISDDHNTRP